MSYLSKKITFALLLFFLTSTVLPAQTVSTDSFNTGAVTDSVASISNPGQQYAVFLPSNYTNTKTWPVVFVMDPRGRAILALEKFKTAAEDLGYILVSSYNTMSDGPTEPNAEALNTMINDSFTHFSLDTLRLYLAGFSGTARLSWLFGYQLKDYVAGVIGFGAGQANGMVLPAKVRMDGVAFAYYGGSGYHDFNYFELTRLEELLDQLDFNHRIVFFEGSHSWPPASICSDALYWMELTAMKEGLKPLNQDFIDTLFSERMEKANKLLKAGDPYTAYRSYSGIAEDFSAFSVSNLPVEESDSLRQVKEVRTTLQLLPELAGDFRSYHLKMGEYFKEFRNSDSIGEEFAVNILEELEIPSHQKLASDSTQPYRSRYARVVLETVYVRTSFYETNTQLQEGNFRKALALLKVADTLKPGHPRNCLQYARTYTQLKKYDPAFDALQCLVDQKRISIQMLESDTLLHPLSTDPRYKQLKARLDQK